MSAQVLERRYHAVPCAWGCGRTTRNGWPVCDAEPCRRREADYQARRAERAERARAQHEAMTGAAPP